MLARWRGSDAGGASADAAGMDFPGLPSLRCFGGGENCDFRRDEVSIAELFSLLPRILCKEACSK